MKRLILIFTGLLIFIFTATAYAGVFDILGTVKDWVGGNAVALVISAILAIGGLGVIVARYTPVLAAIGWLLIEIDNAASDQKISKEELGKLKERFNAIRDSFKMVKHNG